MEIGLLLKLNLFFINKKNINWQTIAMWSISTYDMNIINNPFPISTNLYIISITKQNKLHDIDFLEYVIQQTLPLSMTFHNAIIKIIKVEDIIIQYKCCEYQQKLFPECIF